MAEATAVPEVAEITAVSEDVLLDGLLLSSVEVALGEADDDEVGVTTVDVEVAKAVESAVVTLAVVVEE